MYAWDSRKPVTINVTNLFSARDNLTDDENYVSQPGSRFFPNCLICFAYCTKHSDILRFFLNTSEVDQIFDKGELPLYLT